MVRSQIDASILVSTNYSCNLTSAKGGGLSINTFLIFVSTNYSCILTSAKCGGLSINPFSGT